MADHHRCPACRASVPRHAGFCPACGAAVDVPPLPMETVSAVTDGLGHEVALGAGRANRKHGAVALIAVVVAVLGAGLAAGTGDGGDASAPSTTTLAHPVTTARAPRYAAPPIPELGGAALYAIVEDHVVRIDTSTGEIAKLSERAHGDWRNLIPRQGGVVATVDAIPMFLPDDASDPVYLGTGAALAANDPTLVWIWQGFRATVRFPVRLVRTDTGEEIDRMEVPAWAQPTGDDGAGRLVVAADGGSYTIAPDSGAIDRLSSGKLVAVTATHFIHVRCDERLACVNELVDRATGSAVPIPPDNDKRPGTCAQLAPSLDRLVAVHVGDTVRLHVVDLDSGSLSVLGGMSGVCPAYSWTAEGRHLVWASRDVTVWTVGRDEAVKYAVTDGNGHRATVAEVALTLPAT